MFNRLLKLDGRMIVACNLFHKNLNYDNFDANYAFTYYNNFDPDIF
jgi:hypothetical protein